MSRGYLFSLALVACSSGPPPEPTPGCNPLIGDDCLSPFPSSFVERIDPSTATGFRLAIDDATLPQPHGSTPLSATRIDLHDGVSPSTPFVVFFADGVDATQLPTLDALDQTVNPDSPIQLIDMTTGARLPVFGELDANSFPGDRQALIIRPMVRLSAATRYAIALVDLRDANGNLLEARGFAALRDRSKLNTALTDLVPRYDEIFAALDAAGIGRSHLTLAWDVITASDVDLTGHLVAMRDTALAMVPSLTYAITSNTDTPADPHRLREVAGTFTVPWFLTDETQTSTLSVDAAGTPQLRAELGTANFVVDIPQCAATATGPIPVLVFGHGLFGNAKDELATDYEKQVGDFLCMIQIGTDWIGLAAEDFPTIATVILPDFNRLEILTGRLQQAHVNAQVLTRLFLTQLAADPALHVNNTNIVDTSQVYYFGISDGGIQGTTFLALSQDVPRGVLNVPGCQWSSMMYRSADFDVVQQFLQIILPDPYDQQILLAMTQPDFDFTDPASFAPHLLGTPLPNTPVKQILVQEAINDAEVPNIATRVLVRTIGLPGLDLVQPVFGVTEQAGPLPSAYTQWDVTPTPVPPVGNVTPMSNGAHEAVRRLVDVEVQLHAFLTPTGQVIQTCVGPCVCSLAAGTCVDPPGV